MSDLVRAEVDAREFEQALIRFQRETQLGWPQVLNMQARLLVERLIEWTPPFGQDKAAQKKGQAAVAGDIRRVFIPFKDVPLLVQEIALQRLEGLAREKDLSGGKFRNPKVQQAWEQQDWDALRIIFHRSAESKSKRLTLLKTPDPALHQAARVAGRVPKRRKAQIVIERAATLKAYIRTVQQRVGKAKAGWMRGAHLLAAKFPAWISKSGGENLGAIKDDSLNATDPSITVSNQVAYASNIFPPAKLAELLATRLRDMTTHAARYVDAKRRGAGL